MTTATLATRVGAVRDEAEDIRSFLLEAVDGSALPAYAAGAHLDVHLPNGLLRQYSLCGSDRKAGTYRIAVKREAASRGGSRWMHEALRIGDTLAVGPPRCAFALSEEAGFHLLLGGGIGITPLLSMAYELAARGEAFKLAYFVRSEAGTAFRDELRLPPLAGRCEIFSGLSVDATELAIAALLRDVPVATHCYTCGPASFMEAVRSRAAANLPATHFHQESFAASALANEKSFILRLARSGRELTVGAEESVVECLRSAGLEIETSCEVGVCGTCATKVLEGCPDHRDSFLTTSEHQSNNCFTPCISRSLSPTLVVDL